jgi:hypothetical protein
VCCFSLVLLGKRETWGVTLVAPMCNEIGLKVSLFRERETLRTPEGNPTHLLSTPMHPSLEV